MGGFLKELKARKIDEEILWRVSCRVDDIDAELLKKMKDAGLAGVYLGIESGCAKAGIVGQRDLLRLSQPFL